VGSKNKLKRFRENETFDNVIQPDRATLNDQKFSLKGKWNTHFFKNNNPIVLELGCGKGEYSVHLATQHPDKNYIGIDIKGARFWRGAKTALENELTNVAFLRAQIELITSCFSQNEVDEIWITFPDPQIKKKRAKNRLTHPVFLERYSKILKKDGLIHLKTDSQFLHGYTLGIIEGNHHVLEDAEHDIYNAQLQRPDMSIKTHYENLFLDKDMPITYLRFRLQ